MATTFGGRLLELAAKNGVSEEALGLRAGVSRAYVRNICDREEAAKKKGARMPEPRDETARKIARRWNVSLPWLRLGTGKPGPYEEAVSEEVESTPLPAPTSVTRIANDQVQAIVTSAMIPGRHEWPDAALAAEALRLGAALAAGDDPVTYARRLMDTAAKHRDRQPPIAARDLISLTLARLSTEHEWLTQRMQEGDDAARDWLRSMNIAIPVDDLPPHPALVAAREDAIKPSRGRGH